MERDYGTVVVTNIDYSRISGVINYNQPSNMVFHY